MISDNASASSAGDRSIFQHRGITIAVLTTIYAFSYLDRNLPSLFLPLIEHDLRLTDVEVSILSGAAFAIVYVVASMPLARLADRRSPRFVITVGVLCWGAMTALCGVAPSFLIFFFARMGVGLGEAAIMPASNALIASLYPSGKRARPLAFMMLGLVLGTAAAMLLGGGAVALFDAIKIDFPAVRLASVPSWRLVMMSLGLLTMTIAIPTMRIARPSRVRISADIEAPSLREVFAEIWREKRAYAPLLIAFPIHSVGLFGFGTWIPTVFVRQHGWTVGGTGVALGSVTVIAGVAGAIFSGLIANRAAARSEFSPLAVALWCLVGCSAAVWGIILIPDPSLQLGLVGVWNILIFPVSVMGLVALQEVAHPKARALVTSIVSMASSLIGVGAGPLVIALFTQYVFRDPKAVGLSLGCIWLAVLLVCSSVILSNRKAFIGLVKKRKEASTDAETA